MARIPVRPREPQQTSIPRAVPIVPLFVATIRAKATSAQLVALFQNLPDLLEDVQVMRYNEGEDLIEAATQPATAPVQVRRPVTAPKPAPAARTNGSGALRGTVTLNGKALVGSGLDKYQSMVKRYGPDVVIEAGPGGQPRLNIEANLKRLGKDREEIAANVYQVGTLESALKKAISISERTGG